MKKLILALCCIGLLSGCSQFHTYRTVEECGGLSTNAVRNDLVNGYRTDREWFETIIKQLAWQLDCERSVHNPGGTGKIVNW